MSVCTLVADSTRYRNTIVTVHGRVIRGFEGFLIAGDDCQTDNRAGAAIWLDFPSEDNRPYADGPIGQGFFQAVRHPDSLLVWIQPIPVTFVATSQWKRLDHYLSKNGYHPATVTGRLDVVRGSLFQRDKDGGLEGSGGFGHLNGFSRRIVLQTVDRAE